MPEEAGITGRITGEPYVQEIRRKSGGLVRHFYYPAEFIEEVGGGDHESRWFTPYEITNSEEVMDFIPQIMREMRLIK